MEILEVVWIIIQLGIGYNLVLPLLLFILWLLKSKSGKSLKMPFEADYAIIVTAYEQIDTISHVLNSILKVNYSNYLVYLVADKCDVSTLGNLDERIVVLRPEQVLSSNTKSHQYACERFVRNHDFITIIDSDNLVHPEYLNELNLSFACGYSAVQGVRKAKNLNTQIAALDAARDLYYHFYDGKVLFELGSSATLAGSGMAFKSELYKRFLTDNVVIGAGFDKVLQAWVVKQDLRIAFAEDAVVFDEKTSRNDQLVNQRSRWINTWFKYFYIGFDILGKGIRSLSWNQFLFGVILLRPPLFLFILISLIFLTVNLFLSLTGLLVWILAFSMFCLGFHVSLKVSKADPLIYRSLLNIPRFIYLQVVSLLNSRNANKRSVATTHYSDQSLDDIEK